jgi:predicted transcriptional regulator of viral defense system
MRKTSLDTAKLNIISFLSNNCKRTCKRKELYNIFLKMREKWNLASSVSSNTFIKYLTNEKILTEVALNFPNRKETIFIRDQINIYKVISAINNKGYFSHLTALHLNDLQLESPKVIYWNVEQFKKNPNSIITNQESITNSFKNKSRITNNICEHDDYKIYGINGMHTGNLGVIEIMGDRVTNIERTLIDIVVRPQYSGGVNNVLKAYKEAKGKVNLEDLMKYLDGIKFTYPYHQSIGFYFERAGYPFEFIKPFSEMEMNYDFYIDHQIQNSKYSEKWRLFYPSEFE